MISELSRVIKRPILRRYFYNALHVFFIIIATSFICIVWQAETKRFINNKHNVLRYRIYEINDPVQFAHHKEDAWQMMTLFSALSVILLIFRKDAHTLITD
jgi:hypothetical protein